MNAGRRASLAVGALALLLAGCGASEEERAEEVVRRYHAAFAEGEGEKACALLSSGFKAQVPECERFLGELGRTDPSGQSERLANAYYRVRVSGDRATATNPELGSFSLVKEDGDWKISSAQ